MTETYRACDPGYTPGRVTLIYHIAAAADWEQARRDGQYTTSTRGRTLAEEGFIHASTAAQVALVANAYYQGVPDLVLLVIDPERVRPELRYEHVPGQDQPYPHIYGPLNADAVLAARPFAADGQFAFDGEKRPSRTIDRGSIHLHRRYVDPRS